MNIFRFILMVAIFCGLSWPCSSAESLIPSISLKITGLSSRLAREQGHGSVLLHLSFLNASVRGCSIPMICLVGKASKRVLKQMAVTAPLSNFSIDGKEIRNSGGDCAQIDYSWLDRDGKEALAGHYELSSCDLKIGRKDQSSIDIPIKCPLRSGIYTLRVHFDNRFLEAEVQSYNDFDPDFMSIFFEAQTESLITIPSDPVHYSD